MSTTTALSDRLRSLFEPGPRGTVGLVDELLTLSREQPLKCEWRKELCRVRAIGNGSQETIEIPLPQSVFRAVLARVAALCNEQSPNAVSPYDGVATLWHDSQPPGTVRVSFTNTPDEQRLELSPQD